MTRITRVEVITNNGREYVSWEDDNDITYMLQDSNRTLKVFVGKAPPEQPITEEENERYFEEAKQIVEKHFAKKKMTEKERIEGEIKLLQKKLDLLEEIEKQPKSLFEFIHNLGYSVDCSWEIVDAVEEFETQKEKEMIKRNLKTSLQEMVNGDVRPIDDVVRETKKQQESWMNKPAEELVEMLEKNPPDCLKFVMGKSLEDIVTRWWCDTFTGTHEKWSMEECIDDLIDQIELFLPRSQSSEGTQSVYTEVAVEAHNELLQKIKSKLRNKK
jgi:predicted transcriptional regulator